MEQKTGEIKNTRQKEVSAGSMGCIHSTSTDRMKKYGHTTDTGGIPIKADPEVHPEILQLAQVSH